jgi:hypothetical protein
MAVPSVGEPAEHLVDFSRLRDAEVHCLAAFSREVSSKATQRVARFKIAAHWSRFEGIAPDPQSIWVKVNRPSNDYAVVYVDDGSVYLGWIKDYTFDPDAEDNDFLLADAKRLDEQLSCKPQPRYFKNFSARFSNPGNT